MTHMKKRMTFHGVDYIVVPVELWDEAKDLLQFMHGSNSSERGSMTELREQMLAYEGSNEPEELQ